ncbi:hypothetical protein [Mesorhizobium sp. ESP-6-2]|uniref:hypothetical protein n=1 Tax=Mesorhizobium sp. ESP-6-2 TaxID=2876625 RepID=UPI001CCFC2F2|nr:hypothetical protein [Mesorhizobium sp. ESP-6-2]MBZ9807694.1 hypothetical protein [Mesorhizobium sp. ESP-6-2]
MAYVADNLAMVINPVGGSLPRVFLYLNATPDADATIIGASYFSDGVTKGMRVGDLVDAVNVGTAKYKRYQVASVSGAAATVAAPVAIT